MYLDIKHTKRRSKHPFGELLKIRKVISFFDSKLTAYRVEWRLEEELNRLAETSPHLLKDIGVAEENDGDSL